MLLDANFWALQRGWDNRLPSWATAPDEDESERDATDGRCFHCGKRSCEDTFVMLYADGSGVVNFFCATCVEISRGDEDAPKIWAWFDLDDAQRAAVDALEVNSYGEFTGGVAL